MACYDPIAAYQDRPGSKLGLWPRHGGANLALPCGKCIGCRSARATAWANRCQHEASQYENNIFLTLTYDEEHLPENGHLRARDLQLFIKRLRKHHAKTQDTLRYFACGEYGEQNQRPHYHAIIFNLDFGDKYKVATDLYESETLCGLWPQGMGRFGDATPAAANYIAQYNLNKQGKGDRDPEGRKRVAPFLRMSLKPAIGSAWLAQYQYDLEQGYLVDHKGNKTGIPRTYKKKLDRTNPALYDAIKYNTDQNKKRRTQETPQQLDAHEMIHRRLKQLTENRTL